MNNQVSGASGTACELVGTPIQCLHDVFLSLQASDAPAINTPAGLPKAQVLPDPGVAQKALESALEAGDGSK